MHNSSFPMLFLFAALTSSLAQAEDAAGSDHPLVGRFEGAEIVNYAQKAFDEYPLIVSKVTRYGGIDENTEAAQMVEGKLIQITYRTDKERTTLEVFRAYQDALDANGFEILHQCKNDECGGRNFNHASAGYRFTYNAFGENAQDQRYLAARLERPQGDVHVGLHTARATASGGPDKDSVYTQVDVVESKAREGKVVVIKADEMAEKIGAEGRVALYGIHFDTDSDTIRSESKPSLDEIGKLLTGNAALKILVVGHTDNQGEFDYNLDLSKRRAASVVNALVGNYGIAASRLKSWGVGYAAPAATNATGEGRAQNRRVELVGE